MALILALLCFSALCWAVLLIGWKRRLRGAREEKRASGRYSAELFSLQRERWRRRKSSPGRQSSKSR